MMWTGKTISTCLLTWAACVMCVLLIVSLRDTDHANTHMAELTGNASVAGMAGRLGN